MFGVELRQACGNILFLLRVNLKSFHKGGDGNHGVEFWDVQHTQLGFRSRGGSGGASVIKRCAFDNSAGRISSRFVYTAR